MPPLVKYPSVYDLLRYLRMEYNLRVPFFKEYLVPALSEERCLSNLIIIRYNR